jgi:uncharacterized protein (DUF433 family)
MTITTTIQLSAHTYELLAQRARQVESSPDVLADEVLRRELQPAHPYITLEYSRWGTRAVVKEAGIPVSVVVEYKRQGLAPESFTEEVHPALTPAHVYDALSYYYDHHDELDREIAENTEEATRLRLRERMHFSEDYAQITGQRG